MMASLDRHYDCRCIPFRWLFQLLACRSPQEITVAVSAYNDGFLLLLEGFFVVVSVPLYVHDCVFGPDPRRVGCDKLLFHHEDEVQRNEVAYAELKVQD